MSVAGFFVERETPRSTSRMDDGETVGGPDGALMAATSAAILSLLPVAASQLGLIRHLPDPPGGIFDSDGVIRSKQAHPLGVPDSLLGLASYGTTCALLWLVRTRPSARKLLAAKLVVDGGAAGVNMARQLISFRKLCSWCTVTVLCTAFMVITGRSLIAESASIPGSGRSGS